MATSRSSPESARFDQFEVDLSSKELRKWGVRVPVQDLPFHLLRLLLEAEGKVVNRQQLRDALWPADTFVDFEHSVNVAIGKLRLALGDSPDDPKYIETLPKQGYRFIVPVEWIPETSGTEGLHIVVPAAPSESEPAQAKTEPPKRLWWKREATIAVAACVLIAGLLYPTIASQIDALWRQYELRKLTVVPLTTVPLSVWSPTFSPDGSQIAFIWWAGNANEGPDLYVNVIGNDMPLRLTHEPFGIQGAAWSPDGKNIALCRRVGPDGNAVFLISPLGGPERKISSVHCASRFTGSWVSWSPDGKHLAFPYHPANSPSSDTYGLFILSLASMEGVPVKTDCVAVMTPAFSPRGDYLAWPCVDKMSESSIYLQRLNDGSVKRLLRGIDGIGGLAWSSDGGRIVFSSPADSGDLWEVTLDRPNHLEKLPFGHDAFELATSPAGKRLAFTQGHINTNIWRVELSGSQPRAQKIVASSRVQTAPDYSPDGSQIAFSSNRSGKNEVWISDAEGSNAVQLSSFGVRQTGDPHWSPDGKVIAFDSRIGGEGNIYVVDPHGGVPRKLEVDVRGNAFPTWSHDGRWIYFVNGYDEHNPSIWKVPSTGGHAMQIARRESLCARESPDGRYIYFVRDGWLWQVRTDGTEEQKIQGMPRLGPMIEAWQPFGSGIYYLGHTNNNSEIDYFDLSTKEVRQVFVLEKSASNDWMGGLPVSPDGRWILYAQVDEFSNDIMLVENWH